VQEVAWKLGKKPAGSARFARRAIERVAYDGMPQGREVDAYLMCAAGVKANFNQREAIEACQDAPVSASFAPAAAARGHARAAAQVAGDGQANRTGVVFEAAMNERKVRFLNRS